MSTETCACINHEAFTDAPCGCCGAKTGETCRHGSIASLRSDLAAALARAEEAERERNHWEKLARDANRQRTRVWNAAQRSAEMADKLAALNAALETEQAQHALTKRGHVNATEWIVHLAESQAELESALSASRAEAERMRGALRLVRDFPVPEQDNMVAANMREIARAALARPAGTDADNRSESKEG